MTFVERSTPTKLFPQIFKIKVNIIFNVHLKLKGEIGKSGLFIPTFDFAAAKVMFILAANINIIQKMHKFTLPDPDPGNHN